MQQWNASSTQILALNVKAGRFAGRYHDLRSPFDNEEMNQSTIARAGAPHRAQLLAVAEIERLKCRAFPRHTNARPR